MSTESIGLVLKKKGHEIHSVVPVATVYDAISLMAAKSVAAAPGNFGGHLGRHHLRTRLCAKGPP